MTETPLLSALIEFIEKYKYRPVEFARDVLGMELDEWQVEFLTALARGERRISIRAGHGVGKSTACAVAAIWHAVTRYPQKTVLTAPTAPQLFDALFSELKFWINKLPPAVRDLFEVKSERIELKSARESSFISARTSTKENPEALAGVHSEHVLIIADEASAIPEQIFEAAAGSMSGYEAATVLIGNPTRNSGMFYKTHHALRSSWFTMHVNGEKSARVSADFLKQIRDTYGEGSNAYRVRVLGEFALHEDDTLIAAELVDAAMDRDQAYDASAPLVYGVDIARFGDDRTVLCKRRGNVVLEFRSWSNEDTMQTVGRIMAQAGVDGPEMILIDSIGIGAGVADRLREVVGELKGRAIDVRDVNVSEASAMNPSAAKLRDELWLSVRDWLTARACKLPKDDELRMELSSVRYAFQSNGKVKIESKADLKRRGLRSPDMADALCLTFGGGAAGVGGRHTPWIRGKPLRRNIKGIT